MGRPLIFLASASPRRSELLRQVGIAHEVRPVELDESPHPGESPAACVARMTAATTRPAPIGTSSWWRLDQSQIVGSRPTAR